MKSSSCARRGGGPCMKGERVETRDDARMGEKWSGKVTREVARDEESAEESERQVQEINAALGIGECGGTWLGGKGERLDVVRSKASGARKGRTRPVPSPASCHSTAPFPRTDPVIQRAPREHPQAKQIA